jgi:hypothetical protein
MLARLLEDRFDHDDALRGQLISASLTGVGRFAYVPEGELVGGNLENIPLCASPTDTGCVIAFEVWAAPVPSAATAKAIPPPGTIPACVNPASFDDSKATLTALIYNRTFGGEERFPDEVSTEWVSFPNVFTSQCDGRRLLIGVVQGDPRFSPDLLQTLQSELGDPNLHALRDAVSMADLIKAVEVQAAAR